jgi:hypothetical protein
VRLQAFEEGVELVGHGRAVAARVGFDNLTDTTLVWLQPRRDITQPGGMTNA